MTLILENRDLVGLMPFDGYIDAVEEGYREIGIGQGGNLPRTNMWLEGERSSIYGGHLRSGSRGSFKYKGAFLPSMGGAGLQAYTAGLPSGLQTFLFLFDTNHGDLKAVMEVLYYDWLKTAAVAAVATKHLAPRDARVAALFGAGRHARSQALALKASSRIERIQVFSRNADKRESFCRSVSRELGIDVVPAASGNAALEGADVVTTITTSPTPVFDGRALDERPIHVNAMGAHYPWVREIDEHVVVRSRVVVDERVQAMQEQGEILIPISEGSLDPSDVVGDLAEVVAGTVPARTPGNDWTLFLSGGTGIEDVSVATRLVELAEQKGVGTRVDFDNEFAYTF